MNWLPQFVAFPGEAILVRMPNKTLQPATVKSATIVQLGRRPKHRYTVTMATGDIIVGRNRIVSCV